MAIRALSILAAALISSSHVGFTVLAAPSKDVTIMDAKPNYPSDPNTTPFCSWWWDNDDSVPCADVPEAFDITMDDFVRWNPSLSAGCGAYKKFFSYCIEASGEPPVTTTARTTTATSTKGSTTTTSLAVPTSTTTMVTSTTRPTSTIPTTTTTNPGNGIATPTPIQPGMVDNCDAFYLVQSKDTCEVIASKHGISVAQFITWNTAIGGAACNGLWLDAYVCVSVIGHTPTPPTTTTTKPPSNGIATPTPTQPGMVSNCDAFHHVVSGDGCATIASKYGITVAQLAAWNDVGGAGCPGLWLDVYVCVSVVGHTPSPTTTKPGNGVATPTPTQSGMTPNCKTFHFVAANENCATIAARYRITTSQFVSWNPAAGSGCTGLWANTYACVAVL
ncbi:LysM domain-containing protein [Apiospora kogelbergensis]|uniref:LysM domain-containing protein n=1 Tax=Apiospora kogelbergensis TaxID=1337665 RepID=A0AAW0QGZ3_9PEZI